MRWLVLLIFMSFANPALAREAVSLRPLQSNMQFAPQTPQPVGPNHPLFRRIMLEEVQGMPARVGSTFIRVTNAREFNSAVRDTLGDGSMLAATPAEAKARLRVTWRSFELPFRIGLSAQATVAVHYELSRIDTGQVIFSREIVTRAQARGGEASARARGTGRAAIGANLASLLFCLDHAATSAQPVDCALQPVGRFSAPIVVAVPIVR
jgi:hypothetical protein